MMNCSLRRIILFPFEGECRLNFSVSVGLHGKIQNYDFFIRIVINDLMMA